MIVIKQLSTRNEITQNLTTIGSCMAFKNKQNPYGIVSYKSPRKNECITIQTRKLTAKYMYKK